MLDAQFAFLVEVDKLKNVLRSNVLLDHSRVENAAEHSWHVALFALVLAPYAPPEADIDVALQMLLIHDLVEVDAGDHPIHIPVDEATVAAKETAAAERLFGLLPATQGAALKALWQAFEAAETPTARYAKAIDHLQPIFQVLLTPTPYAEHLPVVRDNLATGRASQWAASFPDLTDAAQALLSGKDVPDPDLRARFDFLAEADRLKTVLRATPLADGSRRENSAEHSWHVALFALILAEHAQNPFDLPRVLQMLLLHDLVEIDAGDTPFWDNPDQDQQIESEWIAAQEIFGRLPAPQAQSFLSIWQEFEQGQSPEARFGKSVDRVCAPLQNLAEGGGSWKDYDVTSEKYRAKLDPRIRKGAPALADWVTPRACAMIDALNSE